MSEVNKMKPIFLLIAILAAAASCFADGFPTENRCYDPNIKTIQVYKDGFELSAPVIQLNSDEKLAIHFDDLGPDQGRFRFTVFHCGADWQVSTSIDVSDYLEGYREENIDQYSYSYNTTIKYTHFQAQFPTANMRPKISGNYILVVYDEDPSKMIFTARFMVVESSPVVTSAKVVQSSRIGDRNTHQQIDMLVKLNGFRVMDVEREVKVVVQQNGRWDNTLLVTKPRFTRADELDYRYDESICFSGGNQFRNFDIKSLQYQSERIARINWDTAFQVYLLSDQPRTFKQYTLEKDLNGRFYIKNEEHAENSSIEADYAWVHFYLPYPTLLSNGTFHILGELTSWQINSDSRMYFNPEHKGYELSLLLKQGYYNYLYVMKENGKSIGNEAMIEGSHWETENDYTVYVYFRETGSLYDRLIAINFFNSNQQ